jgi:hypothetical protein
MRLHNKTITVNGKKLGKVGLTNYLNKLVKENILQVKIVETNPGFSNELYYYLPENFNQPNGDLFNLSTSRSWSTFVSDFTYSSKLDLIKNKLQIEIK